MQVRMLLLSSYTRETHTVLNGEQSWLPCSHEALSAVQFTAADNSTRFSVAGIPPQLIIGC